MFDGWAYNCISDNLLNESIGGQYWDIGNYSYIIFLEDESVYVTEEAYITAQLFDEMELLYLIKFLIYSFLIVFLMQLQMKKV
ncbi:MAG: hypothetical protein MJ203_03255 [archaeon]|nr:hypothetical protein [archaeon]